MNKATFGIHVAYSPEFRRVQGRRPRGNESREFQGDVTIAGRSHEFKSFPLLAEKLFAVLPLIHPLSGRRAVSLAELREEPFLLLRDGHCFRETAVKACRRAHLNPQIVFESGNFTSLLSMVDAGLGVSIVPEMAVEKRAGCCFVALEDERAARTIDAVILKGRFATRVQDAFLAHLCATSS
jgi:LysR family hydrogen peroxide-inducible transcriptional activator